MVPQTNGHDTQDVAVPHLKRVWIPESDPRKYFLNDQIKGLLD